MTPHTQSMPCWFGLASTPQTIIPPLEFAKPERDFANVLLSCLSVNSALVIVLNSRGQVLLLPELDKFFYSGLINFLENFMDVYFSSFETILRFSSPHPSILMRGFSCYRLSIRQWDAGHCSRLPEASNISIRKADSSYSTRPYWYLKQIDLIGLIEVR